MGLLEILEWCEDLKMQPVLAVFAGYALKHDIRARGPALTPFVQDALDEIEYVTGSVHTPWGERRANDGHPAPFPLTYVEIGNEDWFDSPAPTRAATRSSMTPSRRNIPSLKLIATTALSIPACRM